MQRGSEELRAVTAELIARLDKMDVKIDGVLVELGVGLGGEAGLFEKLEHVVLKTVQTTIPSRIDIGLDQLQSQRTKRKKTTTEKKWKFKTKNNCQLKTRKTI